MNVGLAPFAENAIAKVWHPRLPRIRALVFEVEKHYVMVSIGKKSQRRNKTAGRTEGIIRLLLIILWAVVIVVLGFYSGLAYRHH
jgi:hypothetical protein